MVYKLDADLAIVKVEGASQLTSGTMVTCIKAHPRLGCLGQLL